MLPWERLFGAKIKVNYVEKIGICNYFYLKQYRFFIVLLLSNYWLLKEG